MKIAGLQKMTLLDFPGKVACTVFLDGCNFRCPFCHNSGLLEGRAEAAMTEETFFAFLEKRKGILEGVCVTGGEPTLQKSLPDFLKKIKDLGYAVKLDTNGYRPEVLRNLVEQGLVDYVAMDIKNGPDHYSTTTGVNIDLEKIEESIKFLASEKINYEFRTTICNPLHDTRSITQMGQWLLRLTGGQAVKALYLQPFVDRDTVEMAGFSTPTEADLESYKKTLIHVAQTLVVRGI